MHGFRADGMLDNACKDAAASGGRSGFCWSVLVWRCGEGREDVRVDTAAAVGKYIYGAPAGANTAAAVGRYWWSSCGSGHCCGSGEILGRLLRERALLRQWGNIYCAPAGADTAAAVGKYIGAPAGTGTAAAVGENRKRSCWSRHCCGSGEKQVALMGEQSLLR